MESLRGTRTAENLLKAFACESQARMRYNFYAKVAKKEGYVQIANFFEETAYNEQAHAKRFFDFLCEEYKGEELTIGADYPLGLGSTEQNLEYAAAGEHDEWSNLYPLFADIAEEEGFREVAACFRFVAKAEINHEKRFCKLRENIQKDRVFQREDEVEWKCERCGYIHKGSQAPKKCPSCQHPQAYFELFRETY